MNSNREIVLDVLKIYPEIDAHICTCGDEDCILNSVELYLLIENNNLEKLINFIDDDTIYQLKFGKWKKVSRLSIEITPTYDSNDVSLKIDFNGNIRDIKSLYDMEDIPRKIKFKQYNECEVQER